MPKSISSLRIARMNRLLTTLRDRPGIGRSELLTTVEYTSPRTLERDICFLRDEFGVKIVYHRSQGGYCLKDVGEFVMLYREGPGRTREPP